MHVDSNDPELLNVRETARRLAVHENTIRNWARDGVLPSARVPGSRFHRFDARDVERLRQQRGSVVASVEEERRTIGPELVDGTQLGQWAITRDAQDGFPELVRRLLAATPGITSISIRSGDGVYVGGWDGQADSTGTTFLPPGPLWFELGVGGQPKSKADKDYEKRRDKPEGGDPAESIFVFMTPRRWSGAKGWADRRREEGIFSDVRVLDADDLEGWLRVTPAVHHWISERLGRRPGDAETLEQWWTRFQSKTDPPLPAALFLAGRDAERDRINEFLAGPPGVIAVQADWRDDAVAFVCAAIEATNGGAAIQPALIVSSSEVWDRTAPQPGRMTLIPLFADPDIASAQQSGHHIVLPLGRDQVTNGTKLNLPRPHRIGAADALEAAGVPADRTYQLAALARRSMPSLIRKLARDTRVSRPAWSQPPAASILAPLVLVGSWTPIDADKEIVSRMAGQPYAVIEQILLHWRTTDDPPFVRPSTQWHLASSEEAFLVLHEALTQADLKRWHEVAVELLVEADPMLDLPVDERPTAGIRGIGRDHSPVLRRGAAEGVAMVGSIDTDSLSDGATGADHARYVIRDILGRANGDSSGQLWRSLSDVLPLLAEASPQAFLDAVHEDLDQDAPLLGTMFQDSDRGSWLYSSSPHTGLLWALETLCWSAEYLPEASRALARLQVIDPKGRLSNRPLRSLQSILVPWIRQTAAPLAVKVSVIASIGRQTPDVGWDLVGALWPSQHSTATPPSSPRFRDWSPESRNVPIAEWIEYIRNLVDLALELAGASPERWAELSERLGPLPPADRDRVIEALDVFADPERLDPEQRLALWERLRNEVDRHRQFASAEWSMDADVLARMQVIADGLEPTESVERFAHLFAWRPSLPDVDRRNFADYEAKLLELRKRAVNETLAASSIDGLRDLAARSPVPVHLGRTVGMVASEDLTGELLGWLDAEDSKVQEAASSWANQKLSNGGVSWLRDALAQPQMTVAARRILLALNAPPRGEVWDALADLEPGLSDLYWERMAAIGVSPTDAARAARELLAHHRPWIAVDLLAGTMHGPDKDPTSITPELVSEVLGAALAADPSEAQQQMLGYELGLLLDYLESEETDPTALARYEFAFFHLLNDHRRPRALFAALAREPSLFVDLVGRIYRGKNEPERKLDEQGAALANHAWWVINHWRELPGRHEDGTVDSEHLKSWVHQARLAFADSDRADVGDEVIGQTLATSPQGSDGLWPAEAVREIIETTGSQDIESGIHTGVINDRGTTSRGVFDGGKQEWEIAANYRELSKQMATDWPRTSRVLRRLAEDYEQQAHRNDAEAAVRADTQ
jgi:excisionase family DNA binding protein